MTDVDEQDLKIESKLSHGEKDYSRIPMTCAPDLADEFSQKAESELRNMTIHRTIPYFQLI